MKKGTYKHAPEAIEKIRESNRRRFISSETRKKMSEARKKYFENHEGPKYWLGKKREYIPHLAMTGKLAGEKNPNWRGGIMNPRNKIMKSAEYKKWRMAIFIRDSFVCQECGAKSGNGYTVTLNADHIKPFSKFPELRFDINNGRTLCIDCHRKTPTYAGRAVKYQEIT